MNYKSEHKKLEKIINDNLNLNINEYWAIEKAELDIQQIIEWVHRKTWEARHPQGSKRIDLEAFKNFRKFNDEFSWVEGFDSTIPPWDLAKIDADIEIEISHEIEKTLKGIYFKISKIIAKEVL
ncbi:hypothetical protein [Taylorella asinigenitalis]|uniref:hypothetical protein n=1 Tax=Taylorella asinigenitalis TaxID=84590 RepID=UPI00048BC595|nr:hypothetical protein [Taylorella asinigenitalis]